MIQDNCCVCEVVSNMVDSKQSMYLLSFVKHLLEAIDIDAEMSISMFSAGIRMSSVQDFLLTISYTSLPLGETSTKSRV